jgi:predicted DNA-binding transcriptional regulator AlpA
MKDSVLAQWGEGKQMTRRKMEYLAQRDERKRDLLTITEIAGQLAVTTRTIHNWVARGWFPPPLEIGPRSRRWSVQQVQRWIDAGCRPLEVASDD